jgi:hypothetical protein
MYFVSTTPNFETDVIEASFWYSFHREGLEKEFFICIEAAINTIKREPQLFSKLNKEGARKFNIQKFPYGIYYFIEGKEIIITAALHLHDNPNKWKNRKKKFNK